MDLAARLQLKLDQRIEILLAPASVSQALRDLATAGEDSPSALLAFALNRETLAQLRRRIVAAVNDERLTWVAYPKAGQLGTDMNRDTLAALLAENGIQPVRQIAIDDVWSALRFRPGA
jgi:hypothetical protein